MSGNVSSPDDNTVSNRTRPDDDAFDAQRETEILQLRRVEGVGSSIARRLLERFGSLAEISRGAGMAYDALTEVYGISSEMASEFHDRMREEGAYQPLEEASADTARRGSRTNAYHEADGNLGNWAKIRSINQVVTGLPGAGLRVHFTLPDADIDTTFGVTFPRSSPSYEALLSELEIPGSYWSDAPEDVRVNFENKIVGRCVPFRFEEGFVIALDEHEYRV